MFEIDCSVYFLETLQITLNFTAAKRQRYGMLLDVKYWSKLGSASWQVAIKFAVGCNPNVWAFTCGWKIYEVLCRRRDVHCVDRGAWRIALQFPERGQWKKEIKVQWAIASKVAITVQKPLAVGSTLTWVLDGKKASCKNKSPSWVVR
jgi:hypothetical protein